MSRVTARTRGLIAGPWEHPKSGILYYRKATPPDLRAARNRLKELRRKVTQGSSSIALHQGPAAAEQRYLRLTRRPNGSGGEAFCVTPPIALL